MGASLQRRTAFAQTLATLLLATSLEGQNQPGTSAPSERVLRPAHIVTGARPDDPFGRVDCVVALADGGVVVADGRGLDGAVVVRFGSDGEFRGRLGREGRGPGEYGSYFPSGCLTVTPLGEVALHDVAGARLVMWNLETGDATMIPLPTRLTGPPPLVVWGNDGLPLVKVALRRVAGGTGFDPAAFGMLRLDRSGNVVDTVQLVQPRSPVVEASGWYQPWNIATILPDGTRLAATTEAPSLTLVPPSGAEAVIRRPWPRIAVSRDERRQAQRFADWDSKQSRGRIAAVPIPARKPYFTALQVAPEGNLWIRLSTEGVSGIPRRVYAGPATPDEPREIIREPWRFEVLTPRGAAITRYRLQPSGSVPLMFSAAGSVLWTVEEGIDGVHRLIGWK